MQANTETCNHAFDKILKVVLVVNMKKIYIQFVPAFIKRFIILA